MGEADRDDAGEQLELLPPAARARATARSSAARARRRAAQPIAATDPVAQVLVDTGLAHLDRPFEYSVPEQTADDAQPGARVKVRFAGQDLDGFVLTRRESAEHDGRLTPLRRVVSAEPVLTPAVLELARTLAAAKAGTVGDVLRLAIPPRHATAEKALATTPPDLAPPETCRVAVVPDPSAWTPYAAGPAFLTRVRSGGSPGASWLALPSTDPATDWPAALAEAAAAALAGGRGSLLVVPDHRDVARVEAALVALLGPGCHVRLTADQGPQARYTAYLKVLRGHVRVVVGTRAAAFAPVHDLGLVAWWDDGDDLHEEPRAPYPHVRDVLLTRARIEGAAVLSGGFTRTVAVRALLETGALQPVDPPRALLRSRTPRVVVAGEGPEEERDAAASSARLPSVAWRTAKAALTRGPVLVQVPRRGYVPSMSCQTCRRPARCVQCHGPVSLDGRSGVPTCRWCGRVAQPWVCPHCDGTTLRAAVVGARRTAEELGRAFPGVPVHTSGAQDVLARVTAEPALVIATPGAEPVATGGYAAALLLDAWASLDRPALDAGEEALRRWLAAAALTRPAGEGGTVVVVGTPTHVGIPAVEALARWDPAWFAGREYAERVQLGLPPAVRAAVLTGPRADLAAFLGDLRLPDGVVLLGPSPDTSESGRGAARGRGRPSAPSHRAVLLARPGTDTDLVDALRDARAGRSARKEGGGLVVHVDPRDPAS